MADKNLNPHGYPPLVYTGHIGGTPVELIADPALSDSQKRMPEEPNATVTKSAIGAGPPYRKGQRILVEVQYDWYGVMMVDTLAVEIVGVNHGDGMTDCAFGADVVTRGYHPFLDDDEEDETE